MAERVEYTAPLRLCSGCYRCFLGHDSDPETVPYLCPRCRAMQWEGFNPQQGDVVRRVDRQTGPYSDLLVIQRRGDLVDVRPLGFRDRPIETYPIGALVPCDRILQRTAGRTRRRGAKS